MYFVAFFLFNDDDDERMMKEWRWFLFYLFFNDCQANFVFSFAMHVGECCVDSSVVVAPVNEIDEQLPKTKKI